MASVGMNDWVKHHHRVKTHIEDNAPLSRTDLLRKNSCYGCYAKDINSILKQLLQEDWLQVTRDGQPVKDISSYGKELYSPRSKKLHIEGEGA